MSTRLDRIFIRVKDDKGKWGNASLAKATDDQFDRWLGMYLRTRGGDDRLNCITLLDSLGIPPVEIKEEAFDATETGD